MYSFFLIYAFILTEHISSSLFRKRGGVVNFFFFETMNVWKCHSTLAKFQKLTMIKITSFSFRIVDITPLFSHSQWCHCSKVMIPDPFCFFSSEKLVFFSFPMVFWKCTCFCVGIFIYFFLFSKLCSVIAVHLVSIWKIFLNNFCFPFCFLSPLS